ncbi:hypothetical protein A0256_21990 [Mucilaginibacter sp. PAMC 26640]|nr:hypothetical protein A0256_21990 [Mucilaginibacter sp. PAMC 26640]
MEQDSLVKHQKVFLPLNRTLLYYIVVIVLTIFFSNAPAFKSGPCTPNLDLLFPLLAVLISFVLLVVNGINLYRNGRLYLPSLIIHASVIVLVVTWMMII